MDQTTLNLTPSQREQMRKQNLSDLMLAKSIAAPGQNVNFCPYGCTDQELDEHGYCHHLVGFTNNTAFDCKSGKGKMEPMVQDEHGKRVVKVKSRNVNGLEVFEQEPVKTTDKLVRITTSSRVYRDVDAGKESQPRDRANRAV